SGVLLVHSTAPAESSPLSLHDALPISIGLLAQIERGDLREEHPLASELLPNLGNRTVLYVATLLHDIAKGRSGDHSILGADVARSEEHTSELQSRENLVCRLLLEKKKT